MPGSLRKGRRWKTRWDFHWQSNKKKSTKGDRIVLQSQLLADWRDALHGCRKDSQKHRQYPCLIRKQVLLHLKHLDLEGLFLYQRGWKHVSGCGSWRWANVALGRAPLHSVMLFCRSSRSWKRKGKERKMLRSWRRKLLRPKSKSCNK